MKFSELGLSEDLLTAIEKHGYVEATPIQEETIPLTLKGQDVIGQAQTGTGKTAAFGLPILENIDPDGGLQALIISPTRELAIQTQEELFKLGHDKHVKVQVVYGGADIRKQINGLKNRPNILVGTPGRLLDHLNRKTVKLEGIKNLVLDEADEMLNMGFLEDIESILKTVPDERQTMLFSATMPPAIKRIGVQFMHEPTHIKVESKELTTDLVDQYYVKSKEFEKFDVMTRLFDVQNPQLTIIFGRTKRRVDELAKGLEMRGYRAAGIHGDLSQQMRMKVLRDFKGGQLDILVATDVAARGLDIKDVTHVYNYDIPQDPESYVHRIGRTGRAGAHGTSLTFVSPSEIDYLRDIEKLTKKRMLPLKPPTKEEALAGRIKTATEAVESIITNTNVDMISDQADELVAKYDAKTLAAALLTAAAKPDAEQVPVKITPERPLPRHKGGNGGGGRSYSRNRGGSGDRRGNGGGGYRGRREGGDSDRRGGSRDGERRNGEKRYGNGTRSNDRRGSQSRQGGNGGASRRPFTISENKD
ncbi:DEAD/DEAH box helicase [Periweissella cryptocerci]|uniref:DEAD-box ATP-dependent RNA helicase CshA n=1 Tax=Periweissella cryptocerci TaxID=2506420 RepID=A0A4P6YUW7_9LACO|nr:DEAD/DEAH box helicase [Periweissella cryptocerci]QBO36497.1 DEAD/DEAH box helicase [Periweissella cryptocerci]